MRESFMDDLLSYFLPSFFTYRGIRSVLYLTNNWLTIHLLGNIKTSNCFLGIKGVVIDFYKFTDTCKKV